LDIISFLFANTDIVSEYYGLHNFPITFRVEFFYDSINLGVIFPGIFATSNPIIDKNEILTQTFLYYF
jgi:hypothetical protein